MNDRQERTTESIADLEAHWAVRRNYWARKLGRLRLGVEPIEEQLTRYRHVTVVLTAVPGFLSVFIFCLFAVFKRADIGFVVAGLLFLPIAGGAWLGYNRLERSARKYLAELEEYRIAVQMLEAKSPRPAATSGPARAGPE
jgi:hypothetical protein